jgi:hypothetical protein
MEQEVLLVEQVQLLDQMETQLEEELVELAPIMVAMVEAEVAPMEEALTAAEVAAEITILAVAVAVEDSILQQTCLMEVLREKEEKQFRENPDKREKHFLEDLTFPQMRASCLKSISTTLLLPFQTRAL